MASELGDRPLVAGGCTLLFVWATLGLGLETALGFKWSPYVDDAMARELLRLGHAHGVLLSLVSIVVGYKLAALTGHVRAVRALLLSAAVLMPLGFALSAIDHPPSDPGLCILLVPVGAVGLILALGTVALGALTSKDRDSAASTGRTAGASAETPGKESMHG